MVTSRFDASGLIAATLSLSTLVSLASIVLLEHLHTPDAVTILKSMAGGHPEAYPTKAAQQALAAIG